jgi:hypothetical protein
MERQFTSTEILRTENNALAIERAISALKDRLNEAPGIVLNDVLERCNPETHDGLIDWISTRSNDAPQRRLPREWSPNKNRRLWLLYAAADLERPVDPPGKVY